MLEMKVEMIEFKLQGDFIELDNMLKALRLVQSGSEAKKCIIDGLVKINGVIESRIRRKLRSGDLAEFNGDKIIITG